MIILGIETSCDETAVAVVEIKKQKVRILSSLVSSQVKVHAKYGGVVPEVAARLHIEKMLPLLDMALKNADKSLRAIEAIAVCAGPGLISSLMIGVETAKTLAFILKKKLIRVNHIEGHILSCLSSQFGQVNFPAIALVVSGGHTQLIQVRNYLQYKLIGGTRDDAVGEAFDKVAKILNLGYPGGPAIARATAGCNSNYFKLNFPRPMIDSKNFEMSFSGIKTAILYKWQELKRGLAKQDVDNAKKEIAKEFQQAVIDVLLYKTAKAIRKTGARTLILGGGVSANAELRGQLARMVAKEFPQVELLIPELAMTGDNAVMIAIAGYFHAQKKDFIGPFKLQADPNWELV